MSGQVHHNTPARGVDAATVVRAADAVDAPRDWDVEELVRVTAEDLAQLLQRRSQDGWSLERIDYIKEAGIRRPQMAFVFFSRNRDTAISSADES